MNMLLLSNHNLSRLWMVCFLIMIPGLTIMASSFYPGTKLLFIVYGLLTTAVVLSLFMRNKSYFSLFFCTFLIIGCWVKLILHFFLDTSFIEPIGAFKNTPEAWDEAIKILSVAFGSLLISYWISAFFPIKIFKINVKGSNYLWLLLILVCMFTLTLLFFNYHFALLKIGTNPLLQLHSPLSIFIPFMVAWGDALLIAALAYWLIQANEARPTLLFYLMSLEGALTTISMGSRVQMILHAAVPFAMYLFYPTIFKKRITYYEWFKILMLTIILFIGTIFLVSVDRFYNFSHSVTTSTANPLSTSKQQAPNFWPQTIHQLSKLIVDRWVGAEGVLAVSSSPDLGTPLLYAAWKEHPAMGTEAIYQKISGSQYEKNEKFTFMTLPGPIAFFYFSSNLLFLGLAMAALYFIGYLMEYLSMLLVKNAAVSAVTGVALAYLFVQFNFPRTLYCFLIELIVFLAGLAVLAFVFTNINVKSNDFSRST